MDLLNETYRYHIPEVLLDPGGSARRGAELCLDLLPLLLGNNRIGIDEAALNCAPMSKHGVKQSVFEIVALIAPTNASPSTGDNEAKLIKLRFAISEAQRVR